jgi:hypothetical protein
VKAAIKAQPPKMIPSTNNVKYFIKRGRCGFQERRLPLMLPAREIILMNEIF